jgi:hypothetical protein
MKIYAPPEVLEQPQLPALPTIPLTPKRYSQAEQGLQYWKEKISGKLSSPSQQPFDSWVRGTENMLSYGEFPTLQLHCIPAFQAFHQHHSLYKRGLSPEQELDSMLNYNTVCNAF